MITSEQVERGQAAYSSTVLRNYDWMVLGLSNRLLWRCPTAELRRLYDRNVSDRHLDVGVGTGYFLDKATWPVGNPAITLVDPQPKLPGSDLRAHPQVRAQTILANILEPRPRLEPFRSVGLCDLHHCVPGTISEKGRRLRPRLRTPGTGRSRVWSHHRAAQSATLEGRPGVNGRLQPQGHLLEHQRYPGRP